MSEDKPNKPYPTSTPPTVPSMMPIQIPDPSLRGVSYDQLLQNRGIRFMHRRALPCPNMSQLEDNNHIPDCPICDDSGLLYYGEKEIWGIFQSNSVEKTFEQQGIWEIGSAVVTFPAEYPDGSEADFNTYDELAIPDFEVRLWELRQYKPTPGNIQSLRYPIVKVDYMAAVVQNNVGVDVLKTFTVGVDFNITTDGDIQWLIPPDYDPDRGVGDVVTISYYAHPIYKVLQPLRELRVTQELDPNTGVKIAKRLPQQILVRRDFLIGAGEKITPGF